MKEPIIGDIHRNKELAFTWGQVTWMEDQYTTPHGKQAFGVVRILPGCGNPLHFHSTCEEANYIIEGKAECHVGDQVYPMEGGSYISIPAGLPHTLINTGDTELYVVVTFDTIHRESVSLGSDELA